MTTRPPFTLTTVLMLALAVATGGAQVPVTDDAAVVQFQRAADSYAFSHRQTDRRGGAPASLVEGALFTPQVAAVFRSRIRSALRGSCTLQAAADAVVPRVNAPVEGTALPPCLTAALPALPPELEYRAAGVALVLTDAHRHIVVDVLHAALPQRDN